MTTLLLFVFLFQQQDQSHDIPRLDYGEIQAVIETTDGSFVMEFFPELAPSHVEHFLKLAQDNFYDGTIFHGTFPHGIVQGGDPLTKDPEQKERYGSGGFNMGLEPEISNLEFTSGTVVATLLPGETSSAGAQFFVCIGDQPQFTGQFTAFGHVVEGLEVVDKISMTPTDENHIAQERIEILRITIRPIPPPPVPPFSEESIDELGQHQVVMETSYGDIVIEFFPDKAPQHVRHFLRLTTLGIYDDTAFHRVAPGFVIQAGDLNTKKVPYSQAAQEFVVPIMAEINTINHTAGIVSMARGDEIDSGQTSFFIVLGDQPALDNFYTVFGQVVAGMDVIRRIELVETEGERPLERLDIYSMRVNRKN